MVQSLKRARRIRSPYHISRETFLIGVADFQKGKRLEDYGLPPRITEMIRSRRYTADELNGKVPIAED